MTPQELKARREALKLTQAQLGEIFGVGLNAVSRWERGEAWPDAEGAIDLALKYLELDKALKETTDELFSQTPEAEIAKRNLQLEEEGAQRKKEMQEWIKQREGDPDSADEVNEMKALLATL